MNVSWKTICTPTYTLISTFTAAGKNRTILFCFDLPKRLRDAVKKVLVQHKMCSQGGFPIWSPIMLNVVMIELEQNVWSFQAPVRALEKVRDIQDC